MSCYNDYKGTGIPKFPADSRVCFLGDSLTSGSIWVQIIFDYYLKNFPKENIRVYDCGVGQGTADSFTVVISFNRSMACWLPRGSMR